MCHGLVFAKGIKCSFSTYTRTDTHTLTHKQSKTHTNHPYNIQRQIFCFFEITISTLKSILDNLKRLGVIYFCFFVFFLRICWWWRCCCLGGMKSLLYLRLQHTHENHTNFAYIISPHYQHNHKNTFQTQKEFFSLSLSRSLFRFL